MASGVALLAVPRTLQSASQEIELLAPAGTGPALTAPAVFDIPMVYNERVARMIDAYSNRVHDRFEQGLDNAARYEPLIRTTFQAEGLPEDLLYVAMIESSFRPNARSGARAQGIWQFVQSTGHRFGLKSDRLVDERADPAKATLAAARFWKTLYGEYGDWHLAMAAYNSGEGRVSTAIRKTGIDDYWQLCNQNALPRETCNYVPGVIAAGMIAKNPVKYGFEVRSSASPEFDTVVVDKPIDLRTLARKSDVELHDLRDLNPELRTTFVPAKKSGYPLMVPSDSRAAIESTLAALEENRHLLRLPRRSRRLRERA
jgi:membrane-bound lytic murein transglycosylase D